MKIKPSWIVIGVVVLALGGGILRALSAKRVKQEAAQPVREPLTDKSIMNIYEDCDEGGDALAFTLGFARAIERAHGIGGDK